MFSKLKNLKGKKEGVLAWNTLMLYILTFSNYFLSLLVVPYESRVLEEAGYGALGVAMKIMVYFQLFIDFGFLLSATEEVSRNRTDPARLNVVMTAPVPVLEHFKKDNKAAYDKLLSYGIKLTSICPLMYMNNPLCGKKAVVTNSNKLRTYTTARYFTDDEITAIAVKGGF